VGRPKLEVLLSWKIAMTEIATCLVEITVLHFLTIRLFSDNIHKSLFE